MPPEVISIAINTIDVFFNLLSFLIVARVFMSWLAPRAHGQIALFVRSTTEPILSFFRKIVPRIGVMDFSPIVALLALDLISTILLRILIGL